MRRSRASLGPHTTIVPEDFADLVEGVGHPRPTLPEGIDVVNALEFPPVVALAEAHPDVARVLHRIITRPVDRSILAVEDGGAGDRYAVMSSSTSESSRSNHRLGSCAR
jgi:hypothetical protein